MQGKSAAVQTKARKVISDILDTAVRSKEGKTGAVCKNVKLLQRYFFGGRR